MGTATIVGDALRALRESNGKTQQAAAEAAGVSDDTIARWERGFFQPAKLDGYLVSLGTDPHAFWKWVGWRADAPGAGGGDAEPVS